MAAPGQTQSDSAVAELQRTLKTYAQITGYTAADPGAADGIVGLKTAMAVIAIIPRVPNVPREVALLVATAPLLLTSEDGKKSVFDLIKRNAGYISKAIIAMHVYQVGTGAQPPAAPTTPSTGGKTGTVWAQGGFITPGTFYTPPSPASPVDPMAGGDAAIWFYDSFRRVYRVAIPRQSLAGFNDHVEISSAESRPARGTEVSRATFMQAIGKWWWTPGGMAVIAGGVLGAGALTFAGVRAILR